ncbi:choice-of-anchor J domain-containing protein [Ekhidna sp.]|uniref:choice-of-anchor J domain-containing protein n=1 Tax=Ekhidna sp. TaxID=2608089 RepID=UPI003519632D
MKKLIYILSIVCLFASCKPEDVISGPALSFYPTTVATAVEEDEITYVLSLETSGLVNSGTATIEVSLSAEGTIFTNPPLSGNTLTLDITEGTTAQIEVTVLNDLTPEDYTAKFRITDVSGDLGGIGTSEFTLFVLDNDNVPIYQEDFNAGLGSFTAFSEEGAQEWGETDFGFEGAGARMSGFSGGPQDNKDWLISEAVDLSGLTSASAQFVSDVAFEVEPVLEFRVSTDYDGLGDPTTATWTTLEASYDTQTGFDTWTPSGKIDISNYLEAETYFAFYYTSNTDVSAQWTIDDFAISVFNPDASGGGNENLVNLPFSEDFENCTTDFAIPSAFDVQYASNSKDDRGWGCRQFGVDNSRAVRVNAFGGDAGTADTWLITQNKFNLRTVGKASLQFDVKSASAGDGELKVYYSTDYFGVLALATWEELTDVTAQLPTKGSDTYTTVNTTIPGGDVVYLAFQFVGGTESGSSSYDIDNIVLDELNVELTLPFSDDFENCSEAGEYNMPENWIEELVPGFNTDRGWGCRPFGRSGNGVQASAHNGDAASDNAWMISAGRFDLSGLTSTTLEFYVESFFDGDGGIKLLWSEDYAGSGNPENATWTEVTDATSQFPASGSGGFVLVSTNLDAAIGKTIHIAFQYESSSGNASSWTIDDLTFTGS